MQSIALQGVKKFDNAMTIQTNLKGYVSAVDSQLSTVYGPQEAVNS
jgi:hypothetical protein